MKKILLLIILFLTLYPVLNISDGSRIAAQSWTYEGDSYWLNEVVVTGNGNQNNICPICKNIIEDIGIHMCEFEDPVTTIKDDPNEDRPTGWSLPTGGTGANGGTGGWLPEVTIRSNKNGTEAIWYSIIITDQTNVGNSTTPSDLNETQSVPEPQPTNKTEDGKLSKIQKLLQKIDDTFAKIKKTVWKNLNKEEYIAGLKKLVQYPKTVNQGQNGTCGAAALCKYMLENCPEKFIDIAAGIWEDGYYKINGINLGIPAKWYDGTIDKLHKNVGWNVSSVDAIMQGAIVNYENLLFSYDPFAGIGGIISGFSPSNITHFAKTILGVNPTIIGDNPLTSSWRYWNKQVSYEDISDACWRSPFVIGLVAVDDNNNFTSLTSNHFVQITGAGKDNYGYYVDYWSWGRSRIYTSRTGGQSGVYTLIVF